MYSLTVLLIVFLFSAAMFMREVHREIHNPFPLGFHTQTISWGTVALFSAGGIWIALVQGSS